MKKRKYLIFLLMGCLFPCVLWAQNAKTQKVTLQLKEASVKEFFDALHHQTKLNFVYNNEQIKSIPFKMQNSLKWLYLHPLHQ